MDVELRQPFGIFESSSQVRYSPARVTYEYTILICVHSLQTGDADRKHEDPVVIRKGIQHVRVTQPYLVFDLKC